MCEPTTIMAGVAIAGAVFSAVGEKQAANAEQSAINQQSETRAQQIANQAAQEQGQEAVKAREARAESAVAAGASGINLGSNSFLASIQTTTMNQYNNEGLIMENEKNAQAGNMAETQSLLASKASSSTFLGSTLNVALAGAGGYMKGKSLMAAGASSTPSSGTST